MAKSLDHGRSRSAALIAERSVRDAAEIMDAYDRRILTFRNGTAKSIYVPIIVIMNAALILGGNFMNKLGLLASATVALASASAPANASIWEASIYRSSSAYFNSGLNELTIRETKPGSTVQITGSYSDPAFFGAFATVDNGVAKASSQIGTSLLNPPKDIQYLTSTASASSKVELLAQGSASLFANAYIHHLVQISAMASQSEIESAFEPWKLAGDARIDVISGASIRFSIKDIERGDVNTIAIDTQMSAQYFASRNQHGNLTYFDYANGETSAKLFSSQNGVTDLDGYTKDFTRKPLPTIEDAKNYSLMTDFRDGARYEIGMSVSCSTFMYGNNSGLLSAVPSLGGTCQADRSMYWNGLTDVVGNRDIGFSLIDEETGLDYAFGNPNSPERLTTDMGGGWSPVVAPVPEPASWAMMLLGFSLIGGTIRYGRRTTTTLPSGVVSH
jgi:hypothetical protein